MAEPVRPQPALTPERINEECPKVWVLFDLWDEVERRFLPPIDLARRESFRGIPRVRHVPPDDLIDIGSLAAGRTARRLFARDIIRVPQIDRLFARLPVARREFE